MHNYRQRNRGRNSGNFRGNQNGPRRTVKSFNPSGMVNSPQIPSEKQSEYVAKHSFSDFDISKELKRNVYSKGYKIPTPIQDQAIEPILLGRDFVGIANTGTGKTAAFLIPLINKVLVDRHQQILILTPTRELAIQIRNEFLDFSEYLGLHSCLAIGGENIKRQIRDLDYNPNFVIATPGRIIDLLNSRKIKPRNFSTVVLDEADRMVDIGFIKDIKYIISLLPYKRQSLFFSATMTDDVQKVLRDFVRNPITVSVKKAETAENVLQQVISIQNNNKIDILHKLLVSKDYEKVLVFGRTKHGVQRLSDDLVKRGFKSGAIHGNKKQNQRNKVLDLFKRNEIKVLIATDVASRGLDIPNVSHVINYDLPESKEAYIHRIGRTGRADQKGVAVTFVN
ncbi:DEAD/DEAH box helicase [Candidatus Woesebacteria bacterium]|nr:MAG: DEAD/DEAH box helicase [Candidatus Woesebacteria bacterium]